MTLHQNGGSSTYVMEAPDVELNDLSHYISKPADAKVATAQPTFIDTDKTRESDDPVERLPSPTTQADEPLERWNAPRLNFYKTSAAFWSFIVMGANDAAYGVSFCPDGLLMNLL